MKRSSSSSLGVSQSGGTSAVIPNPTFERSLNYIRKSMNLEQSIPNDNNLQANRNDSISSASPISDTSLRNSTIQPYQKVLLSLGQSIRQPKSNANAFDESESATAAITFEERLRNEERKLSKRADRNVKDTNVLTINEEKINEISKKMREIEEDNEILRKMLKKFSEEGHRSDEIIQLRFQNAAFEAQLIQRMNELQNLQQAFLQEKSERIKAEKCCAALAKKLKSSLAEKERIESVHSEDNQSKNIELNRQKDLAVAAQFEVEYWRSESILKDASISEFKRAFDQQTSQLKEIEDAFIAEKQKLVSQLEESEERCAMMEEDFSRMVDEVRSLKEFVLGEGKSKEAEIIELKQRLDHESHRVEYLKKKEGQFLKSIQDMNESNKGMRDFRSRIDSEIGKMQALRDQQSRNILPGYDHIIERVQIIRAKEKVEEKCSEQQKEILKLKSEMRKLEGNAGNGDKRAYHSDGLSVVHNFLSQMEKQSSSSKKEERDSR